MADLHLTVNAKPGDVILMENTRYHAGEEKNDAGFAKMLAGLGDIFVNDAFSAAHRAHSSTEGIAHVIPAYAGRAMQAELSALAAALETPEEARHRRCRRCQGVIEARSARQPREEGRSPRHRRCHGQHVPVCARLWASANPCASLIWLIPPAPFSKPPQKANCAIILPIDAIVAKEFKAGAENHDYGVDAIPADGMMLDVGPMSVDRVKAAIDGCHTLLWNGPFGAFEIEPFDAATNAVAQYAAKRTKAGKLITVAGGGDTVSALNHAGAADDFTYISTAGGAFLEWLEGKELPGVKALEAKLTAAV